MTTWQIVLTCWICYGIGFITGYYLKWSFVYEDDELTSELLKEEGKNE